MLEFVIVLNGLACGLMVYLAFFAGYRMGQKDTRPFRLPTFTGMKDALTDAIGVKPKDKPKDYEDELKNEFYE